MVPLPQEWGEQVLFDFVAVEKNKYAEVGKGKGLILNIAIYNHRGGKVWNKSYSNWEQWQIKNDNKIYQRIKGFNAPQAVGSKINKLMGQHFSFKKAKRGHVEERLPKTISMRLLNSDRKVVCTHKLKVQEPADH